MKIPRWVKMERQAIADTLKLAEESPESFTAEDLNRLGTALADLIDEYYLSDTEPLSKLSINNYGAKCITDVQVPFIDVDTPRLGCLRRLQAHLASCGLSGRVYQTRKGYRLVLHQDIGAKQLFTTYLPVSLCDLFGIDQSYRTFCVGLNNYRARVSAKPWRIRRRGFRQLSRFELYRYPVVRYLETFGAIHNVSDHWQRVMQCHDQVALVTTSRHTLY